MDGTAPGMGSMPGSGSLLEVGNLGKVFIASEPLLSCNDLAINDCKNMPKTTMTTSAISSMRVF